MSPIETGSETQSADPSVLALEAWHLISTRTRNCLEYRYDDSDPASTVAKVPIEDMRLSHLSLLRAGDFLRVPNLGLSSYCEIALAMDRYGWRFGEEGDFNRSPLAFFNPSVLARHAALATRAAEARQAALDRGEAMQRLRDGEGLTLREIGNRFNVGGAAVDVAIRQVRRIRDLRARYPLPPPPAH